MATVTTQLDATVSTVPFRGYREPVSDYSNWARGQVFGVIDAEDVPASGAGDNQRIDLRMALPRNFSYALVDFAVKISSIVGQNNLDNAMTAFLQSDDTVPYTGSIPIALESPGSANFAATPQVDKTYVPKGKAYSGIVRVPGPDDGLLRAVIYNTTANDVMYRVTWFARLIQYDISQDTSFPVNTPVLVR